MSSVKESDRFDDYWYMTTVVNDGDDKNDDKNDDDQGDDDDGVDDDGLCIVLVYNTDREYITCGLELPCPRHGDV